MERESNPMQALCRSGCGFYGNPATDGLCSLCFKEALKKKQQPPQSVPAPSSGSSGAGTPSSQAALPQSQQCLTDTQTALPTVQCINTKEAEDKNGEGSGSSSSAASVDLDNDDKDDGKDGKKKKNRCVTCRKKVGLTGFQCRCGGLFCAVHRYSDKHDCTFDYREMGAQEIRRNNPVVVGEKIQKI